MNVCMVCRIVCNGMHGVMIECTYKCMFALMHLSFFLCFSCSVCMHLFTSDKVVMLSVGVHIGYEFPSSNLESFHLVPNMMALCYHTTLDVASILCT
jgi:hypothetical protein